VETFYNKNGHAIAYIADDDKSIYLFDGTPVAYLNNEDVYAYRGRYLGWMYNGWVYDRNGNPIFFTEKASGGPSKPMKSMKPLKGLKGMRPMRSMKEMRPMKPMRSSSWSLMSTSEFF
jgi:hypothetical protein